MYKKSDIKENLSVIRSPERKRGGKEKLHKRTKNKEVYYGYTAIHSSVSVIWRRRRCISPSLSLLQVCTENHFWIRWSQGAQFLALKNAL